MPISSQVIPIGSNMSFTSPVYISQPVSQSDSAAHAFVSQSESQSSSMSCPIQSTSLLFVYNHVDSSTLLPT